MLCVSPTQRRRLSTPVPRFVYYRIHLSARLLVLRCLHPSRRVALLQYGTSAPWFAYSHVAPSEPAYALFRRFRGLSAPA
jgi:hypothetical protein